MPIKTHTVKQTHQLVRPQKQRRQEADIAYGEVWLCLLRSVTHTHTLPAHLTLMHTIAYLPLCPKQLNIFLHSMLVCTHACLPSQEQWQAFRKCIHY